MFERFENFKNWVVDELLLCTYVCYLAGLELREISQIVLSSAPGSPVDFHFSSVLDVKVQVEVDCLRYCCVLLAIPCCDDMVKLVMQIYNHHLVRASKFEKLVVLW